MSTAPATGGSLQRLAECADAIAATRSKLSKVRLLAEYLRTLDIDRLPTATRFLAGAVFPTTDSRVLSVGGAALSSVLRQLSGAGDATLSAAWRRHGDAGDVFGELLAAERRPPDAGGDPVDMGIDLLDVVAALDAIAASRGAQAKTAQLRSLLERCSPQEARLCVKLITGDMRIGLREGLVEEAIGQAFGRDPALVSRADMLTGDLGEVARLAALEQLDEATPRLFAPMRFMLASPAADADEVVRRMGEEVWVEDKYDGIRCQLHHDSDRTVLYSRDLREVSDQFPEVVAAAALVSHDVLLDGELLAMRDGRVLPYADLQTRLGRKAPPQSLLEQVPVVFVAWDLLHADSESLLETPLRERRAGLEGLGLGSGFALAHQEHARGAAALDRLFDDARARHNEGLMAKDPASRYSPGRRGMAWLKLKRPLDTLDVVVTGAEWGSGKRHTVLSDVTFSVLDEDTDALVPIGKAYTGLRDVEIAEMTELLLASTIADHGPVRVVEPRIVLEIAFDSVQASTRHRSGFALRFPRIVRWRRDKSATDIDTLAAVRRIAEVLATRRVQRVDPAPG